MSDEDFTALVEDLRRAAAMWFNDRVLLKLETLIREAERARNAEKRGARG